MKFRANLGLLISLTLLTASGCVPLVIGAAAGAGGLTYLKGSYEKNFDKPVEKVFSAALKALNKQKMTIAKNSFTKHEAVIEFSTTEGKSGKIVIKALTEKTASISVRIGTFGDETLSRMLLTSVEANL